MEIINLCKEKRYFDFVLFILFSISCILLISCNEKDESSLIFSKDNTEETQQNFLSQTFSYKNEIYIISYQIDSVQQEITFIDTISESNYNKLMELNNLPNLSMLNLQDDPITYLFNNPQERDNFLYQLYEKSYDSKETIERLTQKNTRKPIEKTKNDSSNVSRINTLTLTPVITNMSGLLGNLDLKSDIVSNNLKNWSPNPSTHITLYDNANYTGPSFECFQNYDFIDESEYRIRYGIYNLRTKSFNDLAKSFSFGNASTRNLLVAFYEDANFQGHNYSVSITHMNYIYFNTTQCADLSDITWRECILCAKKSWNNRISSITWDYSNPYVSAATRIPDWNYKTNVIESSDASLTKTGNSGWATGAGAISHNEHLYSNEAGAVEAKITQMNTEFMVGFSLEYISDPYYNTITYAINNSAYFNNSVRCYKDGSYLFSCSVPYQVGDILRVERIDNHINYYLNSWPIGQIPGDSYSVLFSDCSLKENGCVMSYPRILNWY